MQMLFKAKEIKKAKRYEIRFTDEERMKLQERAEASKMHLSEYLIRCGLGRPIVKSNTSDLVLELLKLSRQQKELFTKDKENKDHYFAILIAIVAAIKSIPHRVANMKTTNSDD